MTLKTFVSLSGWVAALLILGSYSLLWVGIAVYALRRNSRLKANY